MQRESKAPTPLAVALALIASLALAGGQPAPAPAQPASPDEDGSSRAPDTASGKAGLRVHLDPQTGEIVGRADDPATEEPPAGVRGPLDRLNTYGEDLLQERLPGGGFRVDLRGRFQSAVVATIDPETDTVEIDCVSAPVPGEAADDG